MTERHRTCDVACGLLLAIPAQAAAAEAKQQKQQYHHSRSKAAEAAAQPQQKQSTRSSRSKAPEAAEAKQQKEQVVFLRLCFEVFRITMANHSESGLSHFHNHTRRSANHLPQKILLPHILQRWQNCFRHSLPACHEEMKLAFDYSPSNLELHSLISHIFHHSNLIAKQQQSNSKAPAAKQQQRSCKATPKQQQKQSSRSSRSKAAEGAEAKQQEKQSSRCTAAEAKQQKQSSRSKAAEATAN